MSDIFFILYFFFGLVGLHEDWIIFGELNTYQNSNLLGDHDPIFFIREKLLLMRVEIVGDQTT